MIGGMSPTRVLIVAHRTAATPMLLERVRARVAEGPCAFTLLVPRRYWDPDTEEAAGGQVEGRIGDSDPFEAVKHELEAGGYDEVIVSTLPERVSHWLRRDLPSRVQALGVPVTVVTAAGREERAKT